MGRWLAIGVAAAALGAGCAAGGRAGGARADRVGRPFEEVRSVALYRPQAREERRGKDVLDGLAVTLLAKGYSPAAQEPPPETARRLEALWRRLEGWSGPALEIRGAALVGVHEGAGEVVRSAGADAIAFAYRFGRPLPSPSPALSPLVLPPSGAPSQALGALVLATARDDVVRVEWGGDTGLSGAGPANAVEAIEALVTVLTAAREEAARRAAGGEPTPAGEPARAP
jgi:hypothetical protein